MQFCWRRNQVLPQFLRDPEVGEKSPSSLPAGFPALGSILLPKAPKTAAELKTRLQTGGYARRGTGKSFAAAIAAGNSCRVGRTAVHISSISGVGATISGIMNTRAPEA